MLFSTWLLNFENDLLVIDATRDTWLDERQRAVLLHCLGTEVQRIFYSLPKTGTTYNDAEDALKARAKSWHGFSKPHLQAVLQ